ncbi:MAG: TetR/AcrR family transcriptional regulator [Streptosporangiales bacterium]
MLCSPAMGKGVDEDLRQATIAVLAEAGWAGVTMERVAEHAGQSRVTLWRQGVNRQTLLDALVTKLAADYRERMWPVLVASGSGRDRLEKAIEALCEVIDDHLPLVLASDTVFHHQPESGPGIVYLEPFDRLLRDGVADGTLQVPGRVDDAADTVMNAVTWTYAHLRGRHHWSRNRARDQVRAVVLRGVAADG